MTAKFPTSLVLFLCFLGSVLAQGDSICSYNCVATDVYGPYCGGANCVYGAADDAQREQLCSEECASAILGSPMRNCVLSQNANITNLAAEQQNLVTSIRVFCDNLEPSTAPPSASASEPLTPSSEAPESADAPDSIVPVDPPESAPPPEDTEPSMTPEPSVVAEPSIVAEPSVGAPFTEPVESPEAMDSVIAPLSDGTPEEAEKDDDDEEEDNIEALDLF